MQQQAVTTELVPWRERAFVSIAEAAQIVARSPDWIRNRIGEGRLDAARLASGGPLVVCVPALLRLIDAAVPVSSLDVRPRRPARSSPRLVIDNA